MAGALLTEKRAAALTAFNKHRGRLGNAGEWEPVFRFLIGQADWSVTKIDVTDKNGHHGDRSP
jgi:hypothetical protein